jgi:hypothetical protein
MKIYLCIPKIYVVAAVLGGKTTNRVRVGRTDANR